MSETKKMQYILLKEKTSAEDGSEFAKNFKNYNMNIEIPLYEGKEKIISTSIPDCIFAATKNALDKDKFLDFIKGIKCEKKQDIVTSINFLVRYGIYPITVSDSKYIQKIYNKLSELASENEDYLYYIQALYLGMKKTPEVANSDVFLSWPEELYEKIKTIEGD